MLRYDDAKVSFPIENGIAYRCVEKNCPVGMAHAHALRPYLIWRNSPPQTEVKVPVAA